MATARVIIEQRHLDTDARVRDAHEVDAPADAAQERAHLVRLVERLHPAARHRSYADGAATFLDRDHLIVAFYERRAIAAGQRSRRAAGATRAPQESLFDA